ncbi:MAG: hypothetical protein JXP73_19990 [Deltaproteobacteria bacterium]|nr:hypothetical protein [Deltaproteobacteria bacterium]
MNDFPDRSGLGNLTDVFNASGSRQGTGGRTQGHRPDCDMLPLGYVRWGRQHAPAG